MKKLIYFLILSGLFVLGCHSDVSDEDVKIWREEIRKAEESFAQLAMDEGIHKAFTSFASKDAVLSRNNILIEGLAEIDSFYANQNSTGLNWSPDFIDVSRSGDLGYTYGHYTFTKTDSLGNSIEP